MDISVQKGKYSMCMAMTPPEWIEFVPKLMGKIQGGKIQPELYLISTEMMYESVTEMSLRGEVW